MSAELPEREFEHQYQVTAAEAEADTEERVLAALPTNFPATRISQEQFTKALVSLVKGMPLPAKEASRPLPDPGRRIVLTSSSATGEAWQSALAQGYGRFCARRGTPGDCLNRFHDGPELDADDKRAIALALAIGPALDAADAVLRALISPTRLLTMVSLSSASEGSVRAVLPRNAVAMSSVGGQVTTRAGALLSKTYRAFKSFTAFKRAMGSAGEGKNWHYIIEQHAGNLKRFGAEALHNTENVIKVEAEVHSAISAFYSSTHESAGGMVVREWLRTQSYEQQRAYGLKVL